jgi:hypothetical protein
MSKHRTHFLVHDYETRCGLGFPRNSTINPARVTCGNCKRLLGKEVK